MTRIHITSIKQRKRDKTRPARERMTAALKAELMDRRYIESLVAQAIAEDRRERSAPTALWYSR